MDNENKKQEDFENYPDIADIITKNIMLEHKFKQNDTGTIKASEAGHECQRYLVYRQLNYDLAKPIDEDTIIVFNEGNSQEKQVLIDLQKAGVEITDVHLPIRIKDINLSGQIDCVAKFNCKSETEENSLIKIPCEIKSMSEFIFNSINTVEDLEKYPWTKKYYAQLQIYMKNDIVEFPFAYLIAKNRNTGKIKLIKDYDGGNVIRFNARYYKNIYDKLKNLNKQVEKIKCNNYNESKYPPRCQYDIKICKNCTFSHICIKDIISPTVPTITDKSTLKNIYKLAKLKKRKSIYNQVDKDYKETTDSLKAVFPLVNAKYQAGKFIIETKIVNTKNPYLAFEMSSST